jgi:hypothetical protein
VPGGTTVAPGVSLLARPLGAARFDEAGPLGRVAASERVEELPEEGPIEGPLADEALDEGPLAVEALDESPLDDEPREGGSLADGAFEAGPLIAALVELAGPVWPGLVRSQSDFPLDAVFAESWQ